MSQEQILGDQELMLHTFRNIVPGLVGPEKATNLNPGEITQQDCEMYLQIKGVAGFGSTLDRVSFRKLQESVNSSGSDTRIKLWSFFGDKLEALSADQEKKV